MKGMKNYILGIILVLLSNLLLPILGQAAMLNIGSITITYVCGNTKIENANFFYEKVADITIDHFGSYKLEFTTSYVDVLTDVEVQDASLWGEAALKLQKYYENNNYSTGIEAQTGTNGVVELSNLANGLYLIVFDEHVDAAGITYETNPFLVAVPNKIGDSDVWEYNISAVPKVVDSIYPTEPEVIPPLVTPSPDGEVEEDGDVSDGLIPPTSITVCKFWENSIVVEGWIIVELLGNGIKYSEQVLNDENNWTYTWYNLSGGLTWEVVEKDVPDGYVGSYTTNGTIIGLTNTAVLSALIPQTGIVQEPIHLLCGIGIIFIVFGIVLLRKGCGCEKEEV